MKKKPTKRKAPKRTRKPKIDAIQARDVSATAVVSEGETAEFRRGFTFKESRFIEEFLVDLNAAHAAARAGYSEKTAKSIGHELLGKPHIQAEIAKAMSERSQRTRVTQDRVLGAIADTAYFDIVDAFNSDGSLKAIHDMPEAIRRSIAGIEVEEIRLGKDGPVVGHLKKVKLADSTRSRELLGRHLKLFTDKVEHSASTSLEDILTASHK